MQQNDGGLVGPNDILPIFKSPILPFETPLESIFLHLFRQPRLPCWLCLLESSSSQDPPNCGGRNVDPQTTEVAGEISVCLFSAVSIETHPFKYFVFRLFCLFCWPARWGSVLQLFVSDGEKALIGIEASFNGSNINPVNLSNR